MPRTKLPLKVIIDRARTTQNGYGYDDFCRLAKLEKRPSYTSTGYMFNKDPKTIKYWYKRYDEEKKSREQK